jgi:hypothetical protein
MLAAAGPAALALAVPAALVGWSVAGHASELISLVADLSGPVQRTRPEDAEALKALGPHIGGRNAPESAPRELLQDLADIRADAWVEHDRLLLMAVDAPGSQALHTDLTQFAELEAAGASYEGVRFTVREASGTVRGSNATVRARVDTAAYTVVGQDGSPQKRAGTSGKALTFRLAWTAQGWRITSYG